MVDRVYRSDLPRLRDELRKLRKEFSDLHPKNDWTRLRIEPLLRHVDLLQRSLASMGSSRLSRGVRLYHSDLVYLRANVKGLREILQSERESLRAKAR